MEFARRNFPGHEALVCTHPDGHNSAGNIHVHIVINSVRKLDVERQEYMERPGDALAGHKHHVTKDYLEYLKSQTMIMCQQESFYQVDLLNPAKVRITDREYWAQRRGQAKLDAEAKESMEELQKLRASSKEHVKETLAAVKATESRLHVVDKMYQARLTILKNRDVYKQYMETPNKKAVP